MMTPAAIAALRAEIEALLTLTNVRSVKPGIVWVDRQDVLDAIDRWAAAQSSDVTVGMVFAYEAGLADAAQPGLDSAWAEAEAALPDGWDGPRVGPLWIVDDYRTFASHPVPGAYMARATTPDGSAYTEGNGDTPAAALLALAATLREQP